MLVLPQGEPGLEPCHEEQLLGTHSFLEWGCGGAGLKCLSVPGLQAARCGCSVTLWCGAGCSCKQRVWGEHTVQLTELTETNVVHMGKEQQQGLHAASVLKNQIKENPECLGKQTFTTFSQCAPAQP